VAFLAGEPEGALVEAILIQADEEDEGEVYAHAVNLAEVFYGAQSAAIAAGLPDPKALAEAQIQKMFSYGVRERNDMDSSLWRDIAGLIARVRTNTQLQGQRGNLALGDAFGVALANRLGAEFVTKDRTEIEPLHDAGLVSAIFIR
jgi:predicted nucleic acid-binding protein